MAASGLLESLALSHAPVDEEEEAPWLIGGHGAIGPG